MVLRIKGVRPLLVEPCGSLWVSKGTLLQRSTDGGATFQTMSRYQQGFIDRLKGMNGLSRRLFRHGFHGLQRLTDGALLAVVRGAVLRCEPGSGRFQRVFPVPRGSRPLNLCATPENHVYFGEYFGNGARDSVRIFGSRDGGRSWQEVYCFRPGEIRHVHGIYYDSMRKGCWVLTGDSDDESRVLFTDDHFANLNTVATGSQQARAVTALPRENGLILPTDTPLEQNYIQFFDLETKRFQRLAPLPGSAFYGIQAGDYYLISSVVEPSEVNRSAYATIVVSKGGRQWKMLHRQPKDRWSMKYFGYGSFILPQGSSHLPRAYAYGQAVTQDDGVLLGWDLDEVYEVLEPLPEVQKNNSKVQEGDL